MNEKRKNDKLLWGIDSASKPRHISFISGVTGLRAEGDAFGEPLRIACVFYE